tara:strand:+ start:174 stop:326 length:153 start_codon:yes stop_codon:yes gene_type:complete
MYLNISGENMSPTGYFKFDLAEISKALRITDDDTKKYFTDGRRVKFESAS